MSFIVDFEDFYVDMNYTDNATLYIPNPQTITCEKAPLGLAAAVALCAILVVIFLLAIPGNIIVGWVIGANRQALSPSDVYLVHLTVADGLLALTLPFWAVAAIHGWVFGDFLCKVLNLTIEANFYTSILFLVCISIDRYLVIVRAAETRRDRKRICSWFVCAAIWAVGWALALPALFNDAFRPDPDSERMTCSERYDIGSARTWRHVTRGLNHIVGFLFPLVVMVTCYSITIVRLLRTRGFQKHRAMRVIVAVVIAFLLCWTPYHLTVIVDTLIRFKVIPYNCRIRRSVNTALHITHSLALSHSCINPILYAFVGEKFRKNLSLLVERRLRQERVSASRISRSTSQTSEGTGAVL